MNNELKILEDKLANLIESKTNFANMPGLESVVATMEAEIATANAEIAAYKKRQAKANSKGAKDNTDWSTHESEIVKVAWKDTVDVGTSSISIGTSNNAHLLESSLEIGAAKNVMLKGPTGTGKTTLMKMIGHKLNKPVISINFSGNMEESDVIGGMIIDGDGKTIWKDGPLITAMKVGAIFVAEEINFAKPAVLGKFNSLLDDLRQVDIQSENESERIIKAHDNFIFAATMNPNYAGTQVLNKAFMNRFNVVLDIENLSESKKRDIIIQKTGSKDKATIDALITFGKLIEREIIKEAYDAAISVRQLVNAMTLIEDGAMDISSALSITVVNQVANGDVDLTKFINKLIPGVKKFRDMVAAGETITSAKLSQCFGSRKPKAKLDDQ